MDIRTLRRYHIQQQEVYIRGGTPVLQTERIRMDTDTIVLCRHRGDGTKA